jgi:peptide/nickel transport system substrate-binding protein
MFSWVAIIALIIGFSVSPIQAEEPQYGGILRIYPVYAGLDPITWDSHDWHWKYPQDTGLVYESLLMGDLQKGPRGTNEFDFKGDAWIPPSVTTGELVETWEVKKNPLRIEFNLRKGVMWMAKKGVMKSRELTADDVVKWHNRVASAPKYIPRYWDFVDRWEAQGKYKAVMYMTYYNANWGYKIGWNYRGGISPEEVWKKGARNWRNITGTGPFALKKYQKGSYTRFVKNPNYWGTEPIGGKRYKLPFVDEIRYILSKDEQSQIAALRTGKVDIMTTIRPEFAWELKKEVPQLKFSKWLYNSPALLAFRMDMEPFKDIRVRRAFNLAINQQEILDNFWKGDAVLFGYPFPPNWKIYVPLEKQPPDAQELYTYNPEKAKRLLAEAGYPNGLTVKAQCNNTSQLGLDLYQLVVGYLAKVWVKLELEPMEYKNYMSIMIKKKHGPAYFQHSGWGNPFLVLRKNFVSDQTWNCYKFNDKAFDEKWTAASKEMDEDKKNKMLQELSTYALQQVPFVSLPDNYQYTAWWPWVKNYYGELRVGSERYGPVHARIWLDRKLKKKMGFK